jgi:hypothetical protein
MSMITELFGEQVIHMTLAEVKKLINDLPPAQKERRSYLLHDWAAITNHPLTEQDFKDVDGLPDEE